MKNHNGITMTRPEMEEMAKKYGFRIARPDHPVYKEQVTVVLKSKPTSMLFDPREPQNLLPQAEGQDLIFFNVIEGGTILNRSRSKEAQEEAMRYFEAYPGEILDQVGMEVVEGDFPGSTYYAARLKKGSDVSSANKLAKKLKLPFRFKTKRPS